MTSSISRYTVQSFGGTHSGRVYVHRGECTRVMNVCICTCVCIKKKECRLTFIGYLFIYGGSRLEG